jgi:hypothetical protein
MAVLLGMPAVQCHLAAGAASTCSLICAAAAAAAATATLARQQTQQSAAAITAGGAAGAPSHINTEAAAENTTAPVLLNSMTVNVRLPAPALAAGLFRTRTAASKAACWLTVVKHVVKLAADMSGSIAASWEHQRALQLQGPRDAAAPPSVCEMAGAAADVLADMVAGAAAPAAKRARHARWGNIAAAAPAGNTVHAAEAEE